MHQVDSHLHYLDSVHPSLHLSQPSHCWHLYSTLTALVSVQCRKNLNSLHRIHPAISPSWTSSATAIPSMMSRRKGAKR